MLHFWGMPMKQEQKQRQTREAEDEFPESEAQPANIATDTDIDGILADIDDVLEKNADEFVRGFIQKGGE